MTCHLLLNINKDSTFIRRWFCFCTDDLLSSIISISTRDKKKIPSKKMQESQWRCHEWRNVSLPNNKLESEKWNPYNSFSKIMNLYILNRDRERVYSIEKYQIATLDILYQLRLVIRYKKLSNRNLGCHNWKSELFPSLISLINV